MTPVLASFGDLYVHHIRESGRAGFFWMLMGLVCGFGFIRFSTRMIRAQVKWWPGNVTPGGLHLHHMLFGVVISFLCGGLLIGIRPEGTWFDLLAFGFGLGTGLVLDEFALVVFLDDVYWREEGRVSLDAVFAVVSLLLFALIGIHPAAADVDPGERASRWAAAISLLLPAVFVVITVLKGKVFMAIVGLFLLPFAVVGAIRVAKPGSPWARARYTKRERKMALAHRRFPVDRRRLRWRRRIEELVGGRPSIPPAGQGSGSDPPVP
jgi:lysyl-tRNA synthetase, class II